MALLRATLFETRAGKAVGLGKMYDSFLQWVNSRLMVQKHLDTQRLVNLVAYHNSLDGMTTYLRELYKSSRTPAQRIRLETELEETANNALPYAERRRGVAQLLLRYLTPDELREDGLLPSADLEKLKDPEVFIRLAARFCAQHEQAREALENGIDERLKRFDATRRMDLEATLNEDLKGLVGEQGRLRRKIGFYFLIGGYDPQALAKAINMPDEEESEAAESAGNVA
jgi:hypothetical protein